MTWLPQSVLFTLRTYSTATETVFVQTDAGPGYLKALGNRGGPHLLAAEWVAVHLARWLGLPTFDFAILEVDETNEVHLGGGKLADPGIWIGAQLIHKTPERVVRSLLALLLAYAGTKLIAV